MGVGRNEMQKHQKRAKKRDAGGSLPGRDSLGLGLGPSGCFMGASIGRGKMETLAVARDTASSRAPSSHGNPNCCGEPLCSRCCLVGLWLHSGQTRPHQASMWVEMAAEIVLWLQVPLFQRPAWRGCCQPRAVFDLQQRIWCVHFTLGPDWPPKAPIALLPEATPKPGALRACMHHCRLRKLLAYTRR